MAVLDFPSDTSQSPYEENGITYEWDGQKWIITSGGSGGGGGGDLTLQEVTDNGSTTTHEIVVDGLNIGNGPGAGGGNTRVGPSAFDSNTSGASNVAIGASALEENTEGGLNVAIGVNASQANTTGNFNTACGANTLLQNTEGERNTAVGRSALQNSTSSDNTCVGMQAGSALTTGGGNTILGRLTGFAGMSGTMLFGAGNIERFRVTNAGDLQLGGTPGTSPNISLNGSDGGAEFDGGNMSIYSSPLNTSRFRASFGDSLGTDSWINIAANGTWAFWTGISSTPEINAGISATGGGYFSEDVHIGGTKPTGAVNSGVGNIQLNADGSARFLDGVGALNPGSPGFRVSANGNGGFISVRNDDAGANAFAVLKGGDNGVQDAVAKISSDGGATFVGIVSASNNNIRLTENNGGGELYVRQDTSGLNAISVTSGGGPSTHSVINLKSDGSGQFAADVISGGNPDQGANNGSRLNPTGFVQASRAGGTGQVWGGYLTGTTAPTSRINADGSGSFAGNIQIGGASYGNVDGVVVESNGGLRATGTGTYDLWRGYDNANPSPTTRIRANGNVEVSGKLILIGTGGTDLQGIQFGTHDTSSPGGNITSITSQTLDDYEEGSWTPVFTAGSQVGNVLAGATGISPSTCVYTKIGDLVTVIANIQLTGTTGTIDLDQQILLTGLPFNVGVGPGVQAGVTAYTTNTSSTTAPNSCLVGGLSNPNTLRATVVGGGNTPGNEFVRFTATYRTND